MEDASEKGFSNMALLRPAGTKEQADQSGGQVRGQNVLAS